MTFGPTFQPAGAAEAARGLDLLDEVEEADRQIHYWEAVRARKIAAAHVEYRDRFAPAKPGASLNDQSGKLFARFDDMVMADRSFRAELGALLAVSERSAQNLIGFVLWRRA